ncbi:MAG TPA: hypothetical protein VK090_05135 [Paracoccaceae bacterium]|nr:hypothetical protein [Paracoccaceae bacterium]
MKNLIVGVRLLFSGVLFFLASNCLVTKPIDPHGGHMRCRRISCFGEGLGEEGAPGS